MNIFCVGISEPATTFLLPNPALNPLTLLGITWACAVFSADILRPFPAIERPDSSLSLSALRLMRRIFPHPQVVTNQPTNQHVPGNWIRKHERMVRWKPLEKLEGDERVPPVLFLGGSPLDFFCLASRATKFFIKHCASPCTFDVFHQSIASLHQTFSKV